MKNEQKIIKKIEKEGKTLAFSKTSETLARIGYGARGLIYGTIGVLAIKVALGASGSLTDTQGAIASIGQQLFGRILIGIVLIGLIGYALWGLVRAFFDPFHKGKSFKGILVRIGYFISAIAYSIIIPSTYNLVFGKADVIQNGTQGIQLRNIISTIFLVSFGKWIVGLIGLFVLGIGFYQIYKGLRYKFDQEIKLYSLTSKQIKVIKILGRFGTLARSVVATLVGVFLLFAAYQSNSLKAKGIDGILLFLLQQPYGSWLLGLVAVGLIAFGVYSFLSGLWFKIKKP